MKMELTKEMKDKAKAYNAWFKKGKEVATEELLEKFDKITKGRTYHTELEKDIFKWRDTLK